MTPIVRLIRQGEIDVAADTLFKGWQNTPDPAHRRMIRDLLIGLGRWGDLRTLVGPNAGALEVLSALSALPPEQYLWRNRRSTARLGYSSASTPMVQVEIGGEKHNFWLDTGTGTSVLGSDLAARLGINPTTNARASVRTVTGRFIDAAPAFVPLLRVGGLEARNHHVLIIKTAELQVESLWGLMKLFRIEGILGWNFIQQADWELDMRAQQLTLRRPGKLQHKDRNLIWLGWPYVVLRGPDDRTVILGLDTGSERTFITRELTDAARIPILGYREATVEGVGGAAWQVVGISSRVRLEIEDEGLVFDSLSVHPYTLETLLTPQGVLGADVLNSGKLRLNWAQGKLTFKPYERPHTTLPRTPVPVH